MKRQVNVLLALAGAAVCCSDVRRIRSARPLEASSLQPAASASDDRGDTGGDCVQRVERQRLRKRRLRQR